MTTVAELHGWFDHGVEKKAAHMIVVCDTYDWEDYPSYVMPGEDFFTKYDKYRNGANMQKIMEVYDLSKPWPGDSGRHWDIPARPSLNGEAK